MKQKVLLYTFFLTRVNVDANINISDGGGTVR